MKRSRPKTHPEFFKVLAVNLSLLALLLVGAEGLVRVAFPGYVPYLRTYPGDAGLPAPASRAHWVRHDPDLGWVANSTGDWTRFPDGKHGGPHYAVNKEGFRNAFDFGACRPDSPGPRVMLLGDSFLFGMYLNDGDTITRHLQGMLKSSGCELFNVSAPGWGIDQMYMAYRKYHGLIKPDTVLLLYIDDDIYRSYEAWRIHENLAKPSYKLVDNQLVLRKDERSSIIDYLCFHSYLLNFFYKKYMEYNSRRICKAIFLDLKNSLSKNNINFIIMRCPTKHQAFVGNK